MATFPNVEVKVFFCDNLSVLPLVRPQETSSLTHEPAVQSPFQNRKGCHVGAGSVNLPSVGRRSQDIQPWSWLDIGLVA